MPFRKRFEEIIQKTSIPPNHHLWRNTALFSTVIFTAVFFYLSATRKTLVGLHKINSTAAYTSVILIGLSMALSGICYFSDRFDSTIIYRKYIGIAGFAYGVIHILITLIPLSYEFPYPAYFVKNANLLPFITAVIATVIFAMMTLISNKYAVHELGGIWWRRLLRLGYIALIAVIFHFGLQGYPYWIKWFERGRVSLPSLGIIVFVFSICVILLRSILEIHIVLKRITESKKI